MKYLWFAVAISVLAVGSARAQSTAENGVLGYNTTSSCPGGAPSCWKPYDTTGAGIPVTGSGSGGNAAAGPTGAAVPADAGYTGINVGGNLVGVSTANPMPITCTSGCSGGGSNAAASATGSAVPTDAGYTGINVGGNLVGVSNTYPMPIQGVSGGVPAPVTDSAGDNFASVVTAITNSAITYPVPAAVPTNSTATAGTSWIGKNSATVGGFKWAHISISGTNNVGGYAIAYNSATVPSTGALTAANVLAWCELPSGPLSWCDIDRSNAPISGTSGIVVLISSAATPFTYTTGTLTGWAQGIVQ